MGTRAETRTTSTQPYEVDRLLGAYDDASTWFAEVLEGSLRTEFELQFDGHELYGRDGRKLAPIFENALDDAEKIADSHPNLVFELRRRHLEKEEYGDMLAMARGDLPNTMVVVSDFPPELKDANEDIGGYNVSRQQTMLRVITRGQDGLLRMTSQSLDHSHRAALEAIYGSFNLHPQVGELLGQRIYADIDQNEQPYLIDRLTGVYDRTMAEDYGGNWYAGRSVDRVQNTYDFVRQQNDLLKLFVDATLNQPGWAESMRYDVAATMAKRLRLLQKDDKVSTVSLDINMDRLRYEMAQAGAEARSRGDVFSGCGGTVNPGIEDSLQQAGYGNKTNESTPYKFNKKAYCVVCQAPPKKDEKPKMCGPCCICKDCDRKLTSQQQAA